MSATVSRVHPNDYSFLEGRPSWPNVAVAARTPRDTRIVAAAFVFVAAVSGVVLFYGNALAIPRSGAVAAFLRAEAPNGTAPPDLIASSTPPSPAAPPILAAASEPVRKTAGQNVGEGNGDPLPPIAPSNLENTPAASKEPQDVMPLVDIPLPNLGSESKAPPPNTKPGPPVDSTIPGGLVPDPPPLHDPKLPPTVSAMEVDGSDQLGGPSSPRASSESFPVVGGAAPPASQDGDHVPREGKGPTGAGTDRGPTVLQSDAGAGHPPSTSSPRLDTIAKSTPTEARPASKLPLIPGQSKVVAKQIADEKASSTNDDPLRRDIAMAPASKPSSSSPALNGERIIARAHPVAPDSVSKAEGTRDSIAMVEKTPVASTSGKSLSTLETPPVTHRSQKREPEYVPMNAAGVRYVALGATSEGGAEAAPSIVDESFQVVSANGVPSVYTTRKADAGGARIVEYDVQMYLALDGDTFEQVSRTMFKTPAYADALAKYNRSRLGPAEVIPVGSRVRIPPRWVLEGGDPPITSNREGFRRVSGPTMAQAPPSGSNDAFASSSSPFGFTANPKSSRDSTGDASDSPLAGAARTMNGPVYRAAQEETLWTVAAKALGDGRRWREIQSLNRDRLTSDFHVPAGTVLRLPDDARIR